jgi:hypothetical protein
MFTTVRFLGIVAAGLAFQRFASAAPAPPDKTQSRHLEVAKDQID